MTRIIGDIHNVWFEYLDLLHGVESSIQIGDFGVGFCGKHWSERANKFQTENPTHRFIRGNHDYPEYCKTSMAGYIQDGTVEGTTMFVGGAYSVDYYHRREFSGSFNDAKNWWKDEELSYDELNRIVDLYEKTKPSVMITHDAPAKITNEMFIQSGICKYTNGKHIQTKTGQAFQSMFEIHQPKFWFFGHYHNTMQYKTGDTMFHCLGEMDYVDFDLNSVEYI